jgi:hypothetical protein
MAWGLFRVSSTSPVDRVADRILLLATRTVESWAKVSINCPTISWNNGSGHSSRWSPSAMRQPASGSLRSMAANSSWLTGHESGRMGFGSLRSPTQ